MRVLIAPDKFKGSLTAPEAAEAMQEGWKQAWPASTTLLMPVADGGDGTLDVLAGMLPGCAWRSAEVRNARGVSHDCPWLWQASTGRAFVESARVCGLAGLAEGDLDPLTASSAGMGDLLQAVWAAGAREVLIGLGGTAVNDAGTGMLAALGGRFLDAQGNTIVPHARDLHRVTSFQPPPRPPGRITVLLDVTNPLLGPMGATRVYGPQKGADPQAVELLESNLSRFAALTVGSEETARPGTGAGGGLGFALACMLGADLQSGFEALARLGGFEQRVAGCDLVLTGEGRLDDQTLQGKGPGGMAKLARRAGKPVIAFAGAVPLSSTAREAFDAVVALTVEPVTPAEAMAGAGDLLRSAAANTAKILQISHRL